MFDAVVSAVLTALSDAGLNAVRQFREELLVPGDEGLVCVGLRSGELLSSGAGEYLGVYENEEDGSLSEFFGFRAELCLALDIYARTAELCRTALDAVSGQLGALPSGLKRKRLRWGELSPDGDTGLYLLPAELECTAWLFAERDGDEGQFTDFVLRGVLK